MAFSPDGKILASGGGSGLFGKEEENGNIKIWNVNTGKLLRTFLGHTKTVNSITFSPDGNTMATINSDSTAKLWDTQTGKLITTLFSGNGNNDVISIAFSSDGKYLAGGSFDGEIKIWKTIE